MKTETENLPAEGQRSLNGKPVLTEDTFDYATAQVGDYVEQAVVDNAMNCLPPACMTSHCAQMGEPYAHREDPKTGKWRPTFATFKRVTGAPDGIWQYCGHCFRGENVERGRVPAALPERCYSTLLDTGKVVILKRGETGYYRTDIPFTSREEAKALVENTTAGWVSRRRRQRPCPQAPCLAFMFPLRTPPTMTKTDSPSNRPGGDNA